jgi:TRAP-type C4-dicarboxylate transport system substrate-binding protein
MSMMTWKKLKPAEQEAVLKAAKEAAEFERKFDNDSEAQWLKETPGEGDGGFHPGPQALPGRGQAVYDSYSEKYGKDFIESSSTPNKGSPCLPARFRRRGHPQTRERRSQ